MAVYKAKVAAGTVADPTISLSSGTGLWSAFAWIERDADATDPTPANHYGTADGGSVTSLSSATLTPGAGAPVDNCRIVYFAATRTTDVYMRMLDPNVTGDALTYITDASVTMTCMLGSTVQTTAAATAKTVYNSAASRTGVITLAIKPGAGGKRAQQATQGITRLAWLGSFGLAHDGTLTPVTTSWGAPTNPRTISGVAVSGTAATRTTTGGGQNDWGSYDNHSCTLGTAGWQGNMLTFSADVDMTGKFFAVSWNSPAFSTQTGDKGLIVVFEDNGGTNWEAFQLSQKASFVITKEYGPIIDLEDATPYDSGGTLVWSQVRKVSFLMHRSGLAANAREFRIKNMLLIGKTTLMGGNVDKPMDINYLRKALHGMGYSGLVGGESPAVTLRSDVQIGDTGTTTTYYDATGTLHAFPEEYDSLTQREVNIPANKIDLTIDAGADDTINLTATAISATLEQNLTFASGTDAGADYNLQGAAIIGVLPTGQTAVPQVGATYSSCDTVAFGGSDATNVTITDTTSTNAAASWDADGCSATSCTIDGTGAAYAIELGTAVTAITLTDCTITAGSTDKVHVLKTAATVAAGAFVTGDHYEIKTVGTTDFTAIGASANTIGVRFTATGAGSGTGDAYVAVKITTSGTTSLAEADVTSAGAVVWVAAPVVAITFAVPVAGMQVKAFATGTQTELFSATSSGTSDDWSGASGTFDYTIMKAGYIVIRGTGEVVSGSRTITVAPVVDRTYITTGSTGLTYTTNCSIDAGTKLVTWSVATTGQNLYSFLVEAWIAQASLKNTAFPFSSNGPNSITFGDGWESRGFTMAGTGYDNTSLDLWTRDGLRYLSAAGVLTAAWCAILTSGASNKQVRYQQADGGTTYDGTMLTNEMDQLVQIYGDATHGNFDKSGFIGNNSYLILKIQAEGYDQAEANVVTLYGQLEDQLYVIGLAPAANGIAAGDPALTITLERGTFNDLTSGKTFGVKIVSSASGTDIMRELRYNFGAGGEYPAASGYDGFDWHDLVQTNGSDFKTVRGNLYGSAASKGVVVYSAGTTLHPDFTLFTADDGTTYSPPVTADVSITGMPTAAAATTRLQIINQTAEGATAWAAATVYATGAIVKRTTGLGSEQTAGLYFRATTGGTSGGVEPTWVITTPGTSTTTDNTVTWTCYAILFYHDDPVTASLALTYVDGEEFLAGEIAEIRFAEMDEATSFKLFDTTVTVATSGFSVTVNEEAIPEYATFAIDGSTQDTTFSPNYTDDYIVLDADTDFSGKGAFAYYCYILTTDAGMYDFWGGITALDAGNIRINTSVLNLYFDESAGFVKQTDDVRIFRDDGLRPALDPTSGGEGIEINWRTPVSVVSTGGSAVTAQDKVDIIDGVWSRVLPL